MKAGFICCAWNLLLGIQIMSLENSWYEHSVVYGGAIYLEFGWAAGVDPSHGLPCQSVTVTPGASSSSIPSQNTPPSLVAATFVNKVLRNTVFIALGFVLLDVPGTVIVSFEDCGKLVTVEELRSYSWHKIIFDV
jgi:hypothetical protein